MARKGERLSREYRDKIGRAAKERYLQSLSQRNGEPKQKRCNKCGLTKNLDKFYKNKRKLRSGIIAIYPMSRCKECDKKARARNWQRLKDEGVDVAALKRKYEANEDPERRRKRWRENHAIYRRKKGIPIGKPRKLPKERDRDVPVEPIALWLHEKVGVKRGEQEIGLIASRTGIDERRISSILKKEQSKVRLSTVDRLLVGLDAPPHELLLLYPLD